MNLNLTSMSFIAALFLSFNPNKWPQARLRFNWPLTSRWASIWDERRESTNPIFSRCTERFAPIYKDGSTAQAAGLRYRSAKVATSSSRSLPTSLSPSSLSLRGSPLLSWDRNVPRMNHQALRVDAPLKMPECSSRSRHHKVMR